MKKRLALVLISSGIIFASAFGATSASWAVTDNADKFGIKIGVNVPPTKEAGYYFKWNDGEEVKLGEKVDTELKTTVNVSTTGEQNFVVYDEKDVEVDSGSITLDIPGDYSFCFKNGETYSGGPTDHTYMYYSIYYTDNNGWGQSNISCYLYNKTTNNGWPGNSDYSVTWAKTDEFGKEVYKITPNANLYAQEGSNIIFSNKGNDQTIDIDLCGAVSETNKTGFYISNLGTTITLDTSALSWWTDANAKTYAYVFKGGTNAWIPMNVDPNNSKLFISNIIDLSKYDTVIFVRCDPAKTPDWSAKWNQTVNISLPQCVSAKIALTSNKDGDNYKCGDYYEKKNGLGTYTYTPAE